MSELGFSLSLWRGRLYGACIGLLCGHLWGWPGVLYTVGIVIVIQALAMGAHYGIGPAKV